jgi:nicotinamidase-related amidase
MNLDKTAFVFIGYQNDYFADDGILRSAIEESAVANSVLENTLSLVDAIEGTNAMMIQTPIVFTENYDELVNPVGILKVIQEVGAFQDGKVGGDIIPQFKNKTDRIRVISGKRGLNAFSNTDLENAFQQGEIDTVVLAGAVTSICIDSTARSAHEKGYSVVVLDDCTAGRSNFEQTFYCENIFPLYATVLSSQKLLDTVT